jgi:UDP-galactopyranose mutase
VGGCGLGAALAEAEPDVHFIGRLAQYRYYNMDQVVAAALSLSDRLIGQYPAPATAKSVP